VIPYSDGSLLSEVYRQGHEVLEEATEAGLHVTALLPEPAAARIRVALREATGG
jgi:molecular chaperone DnaK (HSP70)